MGLASNPTDTEELDDPLKYYFSNVVTSKSNDFSLYTSDMKGHTY